MLHEIGHDALHREEAIKAGGFKEFNIFDMRQSRMEYEGGRKIFCVYGENLL